MKPELIPKSEWVIKPFYGAVVENLGNNKTSPRLILGADTKGISIKPEKSKDEKKFPSRHWSYKEVRNAFGREKVLTVFFQSKGEELVAGRVFTLRDKDKKAAEKAALLLMMNCCVSWYQNQEEEINERVILVKCPYCNYPFNSGPAQDSPVIQCPTCAALLHSKNSSFPIQEGEGVCPRCGVYTKVETQTLLQEKIFTHTSKNITGCLGCLRGEALKTFIWSFIVAGVLGVLYYFTCTSSRGSTPHYGLLAFAVVSFIYSLILLIKYIGKSMGVAVTDMERAGELVRSKKYQEAEKLISKIELTSQGSLAINFNKALMAYNRDGEKAALSYLEKVLQSCPNQFAAHEIAYSILSASGDMKALESFKEKYEPVIREINCQYNESPGLASS